ncbi:uncharacterized protein [Amphiura filiformis]|uniref:uncharacterized protein n=1 Tax=Amphiura filiformis TaxID=82378 RepID=UPI003B212094
MMFTISMTSLGIATHTSWNYLLYSGKIPMTHNDYDNKIRCDKHHSFWEKIVKFIKHEFNPVTNVVQLTLLFSVISYYMALKVEDQDASYWGNQRNATHLIEPS